MENRSIYEFQARDKFFRLARGRIEADSESEAKRLVRSRGLYLPFTWREHTKPVRAWFTRGKVSSTFAHTLKKRYQDHNEVLYSERILPKLIFGLLLTAIGLAIVIGYKLSIEHKGGGLETVFVFLCGVLFLLVGVFILLYRFQISVNRERHELTIKMSVIPGCWRQETVNADAVKKVVFRLELVYPADIAETCYYVIAELEDSEIHLDSSSSRKKEFELGQTLAEYLEVPFICEEQDPADLL